MIKLSIFILIMLDCMQFANATEFRKLVHLHKPDRREQQLLISLFKEKPVLYGGFKQNADHTFTMKEVEVAEVHLETNAILPELVVRVNSADFDGSVGEGFWIWKQSGSNWIELSEDDFGENHSIILTSHIKNGFRTYRVPTAPYERTYNGHVYICENCPP